MTSSSQRRGHVNGDLKQDFRSLDRRYADPRAERAPAVAPVCHLGPRLVLLPHSLPATQAVGELLREACRGDQGCYSIAHQKLVDGL